MFSNNQEELLQKFANFSDRLFELGVISTDSFTGEIGEYIVCNHFNLIKSKRVTRAVDGVSLKNERYQIKAKVISNNNFGYNLKDLEHELFDTLAIIYFDKIYTPLKIIIVPAKEISNGEIKINSSAISKYVNINSNEIIVPNEIKTAINNFANAYNELAAANIIRSRRVVGDIGELYASHRLNLILSVNKNEKGIDARHENGKTFEIKTRRVYDSGRRTGEKRRLNNIIGKTADYLIVVTLDRCFKCSGMWIIPMKNLSNPKSANLKIVNTTPGTRNLIPSTINYLNSGQAFEGFDGKPETLSSSKTQNKPHKKPQPKSNTKTVAVDIKSTKVLNKEFESINIGGCLSLIFVIIIIILFIIANLG